jgi:K+-sensing histidine kinase KdpD
MLPGLVIDHQFHAARRTEPMGQSTRLGTPIPDASIVSGEHSLDDLLRAVIHDGRNFQQRSLAAIELLRQRLNDRPDCQSLLNDAQDALDQLQRVQESFRICLMPVYLRLSTCHLVEQIQSAWEAITPQAHRRRASLTIHGPDDCEPIIADSALLADALASVLHALMSMADAGSSIHVRIEKTPDGMTTHFQADGLAADESLVNSWFDPLEHPRRAALGLGQSAARQIVQAHGGTLTVGNDEAGQFLLQIQLPRELP